MHGVWKLVRKLRNAPPQGLYWPGPMEFIFPYRMTNTFEKICYTEVEIEAILVPGEVGMTRDAFLAGALATFFLPRG